MLPPLICFVTFNRMGLTVRNLKALLNTGEDFELILIDNHSMDNTWDYLKGLNDKRIKSKIRLSSNYGPIYAVNLALSKRKSSQYFITVDSDVHIHTNDWISRFMRVFEAFPEAGLLGVPKGSPYPYYLPEVIERTSKTASYLELKNGSISTPADFVPGHLQCLRPELIEVIGYWSEECHFGDAEISARINNYTSFRAGFVTDIEIDMVQSIPCNLCESQRLCRLDKKNITCFRIHRKQYKNVSFVRSHGWKFKEVFKELDEGKRPVFCASIHDPESIRKHLYNVKWARENFDFYSNA